ncbi:globin domain-containing protein [Armatimonas sp.]|uniref:globin domain-containing protein n=1 Tax=Armatimonas sp. TaxID=1872638 RepID=UPI00286A4501|nr:globin domain-containing protein [Armatimonas sp.]
MTESQKALLRSLLERALIQNPKDTQTLAALFYQRLFTVAPGVRPLFSNKLSLQEAKFTQMLESLLSNLDRLDNLVPVLWQSGRNHKLYGAEEAHYAVVGEALLYALEAKLGAEHITDEVRAAWKAFYDLVALIMQEAAKEA